MNDRRAMVVFALNLLVWGYNWVPLHLLLYHVHPAMAGALRLAGGALTLFVVLALMRRPIAPPRTRTWIWTGLLQVTGAMGISTFALMFGDVSRTAILMFTMPFWTMLLARVVLKEEIGRRRWLAMGIALCGIAIIASASLRSPNALIGGGLAILAGMMWAGGTIVAKKAGPAPDLLRAVAWQQFAGATPLVVLAIVVRAPLPQPTPDVLALLAFTAIVGSGLGWLLWNGSVDALPPRVLALGSLGIPLVASLSAFIQLREIPDAVTLAGLSAILLALVIATIPTLGVRRRVAASSAC